MKLWEPTAERIQTTNLSRLIAQVEDEHSLTLRDYHAFYDWSVREPELFWSAVWNFCGVVASHEYSRVLCKGETMSDAEWFPDSRLNFAENLLRYRDDKLAIVFWGEDKVRRTLSYAELFAATARVAAYLKQQGVTRGDRVAGFMPNIPDAVIAMLATTSLGAVWSSCSPDFGAEGVVDRFGQIEPKVLFAADAYYYKGRKFDSLNKLNPILAAIPSIQQVVVSNYVDSELDQETIGSRCSLPVDRFTDIVGVTGDVNLEFEQMCFDDPLYVMYSSGTTGRPKCIVHGIGGTLIEHLKELMLHTDLTRDDRITYVTTCGWMMWNWLVSSLATGATVVLYDGATTVRDSQIMFDMIDAEQISVFGTSAGFISAIHKAGLRPAETHRLNSLRSILSTGSTLVPESFDYVYQSIKRDVCLSSISGGTDIIGCFALGCPLIPVYHGQLQTRSLGYAVNVFDDEGRSVVGEKGELVCTSPFPSMPIGFWNDRDGKKYHQAYYSRYDDVWHHGDYVMLTEEQGMIFYGRSDAVLNPGGVRIGTAEMYRPLETIEQVESSVVVGQQWKNDTRIVLFVKLKESVVLDETLRKNIRSMIRSSASPRHVPEKIIQVDDIPITRSGKISELAVTNAIHGLPIKNVEALANPESLECYRGLDELGL